MTDQKQRGTPVTVKPKETKRRTRFRSPLLRNSENQQLNHFQKFLCNTDGEREHLSNAIDLWDNVPRYSVSRQAMDAARINDCYLKPHEAEFQYKGRTFD